ncbi:MAG: PDZ domain-containing protein [Planctomycetes bacterium]|nr:PDZ domain-containing protein [Planctomycetota bacterium]
MPKRFRSVAFGLLLANGLFGIGGRRLESAEISALRRTAIVKAVEQAKESVVNIHGRKSVRVDPRQAGASTGPAPQVNGMGTGILIDERGYVLTNYHVIDGVSQIKVTLADERTLTATLVANDVKTDLAVIKIPATDPLPVIRIGTSSDLMPGEEVIAVGNAYGYMHTVTRGIISALHRSVQVSEEQHYPDLIQTDASINPGNSGGPLLNIDGEMIGINVAVRVGAQGIGFALPIDEATEIAARLIASERAGSLGVRGETRIADRVSRFVVTHVDTESPATASRLQPGDVVTSVGGMHIARTLDWERAWIDAKLGESMAVEVERNGKATSCDLAKTATTARENGSVESLVWSLLGLKLAAVDPAAIVGAGESRYRGGLRVVSVRADGPAAQRGVRRGDVLVGIHKWETTTLDHVAYIIKDPEFRSSQPVKFYVLRGEETLYGHLRVSFGSSE